MVCSHDFSDRFTNYWVAWISRIQRLDEFILTGVMDHEQYENLLDALFDMYDRFGLTGSERPEYPRKHGINI